MKNQLQPSQTTKAPTSPFEGFKKLKTDPKFTALSPEKKADVVGKLYDKHVVSYYKGKGVDLTPERRQQFIKSVSGQNLTAPKVADTKASDIQFHRLLLAGKQGLKVERGIDEGANKIGDTIQSVMSAGGADSIAGRLGSKFNNWLHSKTQEDQNPLNRMEDRVNAYLGSEYADSLMVKAGDVPLRVTGTLTADTFSHPEYVAIPEATSLGVGGVLGKLGLSEALLQGSTKGKIAYNAIKGAADGYLTGKYEGESNKEAAGTGAIFSIGEAVISSAKPAIKFLSKLNVWGGPKKVEQALGALDKITPEQLAKADPNKVSTQVLRGVAKSRDEVAQQLGFKDYAEAKAAGKSAQTKVGLAYSRLLKQANREAAIHNPELIAVQVHKDGKEWAASPQAQTLVQGLTKMGIDPIKAATTTVLENTKAANGDFSAIKAKINESAKASVIKMLEGLGPGAASTKEKDIFKAVLKVIDTNIPMESKAHTFTFMWGVRNELPKEITPTLIEGMKILYGPNPKLWDSAAKRLDTHMDKMISTGHINPNDQRGVFHSTKLTGLKTKWQKQLDDELRAVRGEKPSIQPSQTLHSEESPRKNEYEEQRKINIQKIKELREFSDKKREEFIDAIKHSFSGTPEEKATSKIKQDALWDEHWKASTEAFELEYSNKKMDARIGEVRKLPDGNVVVYASNKTMESLQKSINPWAIFNELHGFNTTKEDIDKILARIDRWDSKNPDKENVKNLLIKAKEASNDKSGVTVVGIKNQGISSAIDTMREELLHSWQRSIGDGLIDNHLSKESFEQLNDKIPTMIKEYLKKNGYSEDAATTVIEASAKLMAGKVKKLGVSDEEAASFLEAYFKEVQAKHGSQALENITHAHGIARRTKASLLESTNAAK